MESPDGCLPASSCEITLGGEVVRSITDTRLSAVCFVGSAGSIFIAQATSAKLSSGVTATESGGPMTLPGAFTSAMTLGGECLRSMIVTVSGGGLRSTLTVPLSSVTLLSFDDTASSAVAVRLAASVETQASTNRQGNLFDMPSLRASPPVT